MLRRKTSENLIDLIQAEFQTSQPILIGEGGEGMVFRADGIVFKCLQRPELWKNEKALPILKQLPQRLRGYTTLPDVVEVREVGEILVIVTKWEDCEKEIGPTKPEEFLLFLRECQDAGISHRNIKCDNFVRTPRGIKLVDLGHDVREIRPDRFHDMAIRTFLTWRYPQRDDLPEIMRECLTQKDHPALTGYSEFMMGLDTHAYDNAFDDHLKKICLRQPNRTMLDYGAGKGKLARFLESKNYQVVAYEPDWTKCPYEKPTHLSCVDRKGLDALKATGQKFDLIVMSRVACEIESDNELVEYLKEIRQLLSENGHFVFALCNPFFADVRRTATELKTSSEGLTEACSGVIHKKVVAFEHERKCHYRRFECLQRIIRRAGFVETYWEETPNVDLDRCAYASDYLIMVYRPAPLPAKVSLLIKVCAMDHELAPDFIEHIVEQMEVPQAFDERVVVVDCRDSGFTREYATPDRITLLHRLQQLVQRQIIDRVIETPVDLTAIKDTYGRWFGSEIAEKCHATHSEKGAQNFATLFGINACRNELVLAIDWDLLIKRKDFKNVWLQRIVDIFENDPEAIFASPSICHAEKRTPAYLYENGRPYRVDPRATIWHKGRIDRLLPLNAEVNTAGELILSWHRLFDRLISSGLGRAYRMHDAEFGFIHIPNEVKKDPDELLFKLDQVETGNIPADQNNRIDLVEDKLAWSLPTRFERYVFLVTGRNVAVGEARSCVESILQQDRTDFGIGIVDDASDNQTPQYLKRWLSAHPQVTLIRNRRRKGSLFNHNLVIQRICGNPQSVIITLDMDDRLITQSVLSRLEREYEKGADMTVGSMFGSDKKRIYKPDFSNPRSRHNNLWQHLRTFKKYLFDNIPKDRLILDGQWIEYASDWSYMVQIGEQAQSPRYIEDILYFYNPSPRTNTYRGERDQVIARILAQPPVTLDILPHIPLIAVIGDADVQPTDTKYRIAEEIGKRIVEMGWRLVTGGMCGIMEAASKGARLSSAYRSGSVVAILPGLDPALANKYADLVIATGLADYRNGIVANADAVIAVGGGAGTLSEIAFAWMRRRLIIALEVDGWSSKVANTRLDSRNRKVTLENDCIYAAQDAETAIRLLVKYLPYYQNRPRSLVKQNNGRRALYKDVDLS